MNNLNFSNRKFELNAETRISVSTWQESRVEHAHGAVALERLVAGEWRVDGETAVELARYTNANLSLDKAIVLIEMQVMNIAADHAEKFFGSWNYRLQILTGKRLIIENGEPVKRNRAGMIIKQKAI